MYERKKIKFLRVQLLGKVYAYASKEKNILSLTKNNFSLYVLRDEHLKATNYK